MSYYKITNKIFHLQIHSHEFAKRFQPYQVHNTPQDYEIVVTPTQIQEFQNQYPYLTLADCENILTTQRFNDIMLKEHHLVLHASAISYQDKAVCFCARSGVGKSTHTQLWKDEFHTPIINDDKPVLLKHDDHYEVYGTPFSGTSEENLNIHVPLHAIVFIKRSEQNTIRLLSNKEAIVYLFDNICHNYKSKLQLEYLFPLLDHLITHTKFYELSCNMEKSACLLAKQTLFPD